MFRKTLLILALAGAPALAAQQPAQQPTTAKAAKPKAAADTTKVMAHRRHARKAKPAPTAATPRDTTKRP